MTREEAIKWLEEAVNDTNIVFDLCSDALKKELLLQKDVFEMAVSALKYPLRFFPKLIQRLQLLLALIFYNTSLYIG